MADKSITVISLPQMVDLALNSPEVGIVNFTVLHSLLHVIVNQLDLGDCNVEFRGSDSERLQNYIATAKPGPIITLTEYTVGPDGKGRKKRRGSKKNGKRSSVADEKGKKDENQKEKEIAIIKKEDDPSIANAESSSSFQTIVVVEPASKEKIGDTPKFTIALTKEQLTKLQKDIKDLQQQVRELTDLPANIGLIDALRSSKDGSNTPLLEMFQILTLVKRLDATEGAINKMATMMEDLAKDTQAGGRHLSVGFKEQAQAVSNLVTKSQELRKSIDQTAAATSASAPASAPAPAPAPAPATASAAGPANANAKPTSDNNKQIQELYGLIQEVQDRVTELEKFTQNLSTKGTRGSISSGDKPSKPAPKKHKAKPVDDDDEGSDEEAEEVPSEGNVDLESTNLSQLPVKEAIRILQHELLTMKETYVSNDSGLEALKEVLKLKETLMSPEENTNMPPDVKLGQLDLKIGDLRDQVGTQDTVYNQRFQGIDQRIEKLTKEISSLWERINLGLPAGDGPITDSSNQGLQDIYTKIKELQDEISNITEATNNFKTEKDEKDNTLDIITEQIELLKTVKANKEDLEDALADKADACQINRKVSHEQFDAAYDEMTKSLEDTLDKLKKQEELWIQSLNDLQKEIGNKLDKMELTPLKDFINAKLKVIQDRVKKISALKQEQEAAGTKSKLLRNVNCISCDADVIMKKTTDITVFPKPYAMPASKNPGPYLAYELDQLRKQQKTLPNSKNLNMFESALHPAKAKGMDPDHICNRYCGGSHTVTTPQQRVMRVGHFMDQWGPEISPVNEVLIKGTDGHLYKGRDDALLRALANEKAPTPRVDAPAMIVTEYNLNKDAKDDAQHEAEVFKLDPNVGTGGSKSSISKRPKSSGDALLAKSFEAQKRASLRSADGNK